MHTRIARVLAAVAAAVLLATGIAVPAQAATGPAGEVYTLLNQQRAAHGLGPLMTDPTLDNAAWQWANYLATTGQFMHSSSEWRNSMINGAGWVMSGENIAAGYTSASSVMNAWMGSTGHRNNILNTSYVGVGVAYVAGGPYGHYWVQIFAGSQPRVAPGSATVSGSATIGGTLTATPTGWAGGVSYSYAWQSNGAVIPGAVSATYTPSLSDANRRITVTITGSRAGYYPASATSGPTAAVTGGPSSERIAGSDRFATSVAISKAGFGAGVPVVYVASGLNFPDALGSAPAASLTGGPLLLTAQDALPTTVKAEIQRLAPARIVVVGGTPSVSASVFAALQKLAPEVVRLSGGDRFETSRAIVADAFSSAAVAYIATGNNFPDALTASAAAARVGAPVVLVNGGASSAGSATVALLKSLGVTTVRIAGASGSVSTGIQNSLASAGFAVERLAGDDRYETANAINRQVFPTAPTVYLASGVTFPDALAGAALAGAQGAPLFVASGTCIPHSVSVAIARTGATRVVLLGGTPTLNADVASFRRC